MMVLPSPDGTGSSLGAVSDDCSFGAIPARTTASISRRLAAGSLETCATVASITERGTPICSSGSRRAMTLSRVSSVSGSADMPRNACCTAPSWSAPSLNCACCARRCSLRPSCSILNASPTDFSAARPDPVWISSCGVAPPRAISALNRSSSCCWRCACASRIALNCSCCWPARNCAICDSMFAGDSICSGATRSAMPGSSAIR